MSDGGRWAPARPPCLWPEVCWLASSPASSTGSFPLETMHSDKMWEIQKYLSPHGAYPHGLDGSTA